MEICTECNDRPVLIKRRGLCARCYQRYRKKDGPVMMNNPNYEYLAPTSIQKHSENREMEFVKNFFNHNRWVHQPCHFRFPDGSYAPDFYDAERNVFIEVAGTRQAYHLNKGKYDSFAEHFPKLKLEIRIPTGELLEEADHKWHHQTHPAP